MTDTAAQAAWRWQQADDAARLVLATGAPKRAPVPMLAAVLVAGVALLIVAALLNAPGSTGRWVVATVAAVVGISLVAVDVVRAVRGRAWHPERLPVGRSLTDRERRAVGRAIRGRVAAPDDRSEVVRATAVQRSGGRGLLSVIGQFVLLTGFAVSGAVFWFVYLAAAVAAAVALAVALLDVLAAQRYLDAHPVRP